MLTTPNRLLLSGVGHFGMLYDNFQRTGSSLGRTSDGKAIWSNQRGTWYPDGFNARTSTSEGNHPFATLDWKRIAAVADMGMSNAGGDALYFWAQNSTNWYRLRYYYDYTPGTSTPIYEYEWIAYYGSSSGHGTTETKWHSSSTSAPFFPSSVTHYGQNGTERYNYRYKWQTYRSGDEYYPSGGEGAGCRQTYHAPPEGHTSKYFWSSSSTSPGTGCYSNLTHSHAVDLEGCNTFWWIGSHTHYARCVYTGESTYSTRTKYDTHTHYKGTVRYTGNRRTVDYNTTPAVHTRRIYLDRMVGGSLSTLRSTPISFGPSTMQATVTEGGALTVMLNSNTTVMTYALSPLTAGQLFGVGRGPTGNKSGSTISYFELQEV